MERCRLCSSKTMPRFVKRILGKYDIQFMQCVYCDSMQTEKPYWLGESYSDERRQLDTNAVARAQTWQRLLFMAMRGLRLGGSATVLDWGAGDGLLVRMLRDVGLNTFYHDPLATNVYAYGQDWSGASCNINAMVAFEVWEHLATPAEDLAEMFDVNPDVYFATTNLYTGQGEDWSYLNLLTGRHVFFYSPKAVEFISEKHGYASLVVSNKRVMLYKRSISDRRIRRVRRILTDRPSRVKQAYFSLLHRPSLGALDKQAAVKRVAQEQGVGIHDAGGQIS